MIIKHSRSEQFPIDDDQSAFSIKIPNPQGKGTCHTLGVLAQAGEALQLPATHTDSLKRIVSDYLHSLLVLSCTFKFKPVVGKRYHIYSHNRMLVLSLVAPADGRKMIYDKYIGGACLKSDFSWSLDHVNAENIPLIFQLKTVGEPGYSESIQEDSLLAVLREISSKQAWKFNNDVGYYQNVMNFMLQKVLRLRLKRLIRSDHLLSAQERSLLYQK